MQAYDPASIHEAKNIFNGSVSLCDDAIKTTEGADAIVLITEWPEFRLARLGNDSHKYERSCDL